MPINPLVPMDELYIYDAYSHYTKTLVARYQLYNVLAVLPVFIKANDASPDSYFFNTNIFYYNPNIRRVCLHLPLNELIILNADSLKTLLETCNCQVVHCNKLAKRSYEQQLAMWIKYIVDAVTTAYKSKHNVAYRQLCQEISYSTSRGTLAAINDSDLVGVDHNLLILHPLSPFNQYITFLDSKYITATDRNICSTVKNTGYRCRIPYLKKKFYSQYKPNARALLLYSYHTLTYNGNFTCHLNHNSDPIAYGKYVTADLYKCNNLPFSEQLLEYLYMLSNGSCSILDDIACLLARCFINEPTSSGITVLRYNSADLVSFIDFIAMVVGAENTHLVSSSDPILQSAEDYYLALVKAKYKRIFCTFFSGADLLFNATKTVQAMMHKAMQNKKISCKDKLFGTFWVYPLFHTIVCAKSNESISLLQQLTAVHELSLPDDIPHVPSLSENDLRWIRVALAAYGLKLLIDKPTPIPIKPQPDILYHDFVANCCELGTEHEVTLAAMYDSFDDYCTRLLGKRYLSHPKLKTFLTSNFPVLVGRPHHSREDGNPYCFLGIRLSPAGLATAASPAIAPVPVLSSRDAFVNHLQKISSVLQDVHIPTPHVRVVQRPVDTP